MKTYVLAATIVLVGSVGLAQELKSGPPVGARNNRGAFFPNLVTGPGAGERRCPV
jgi:hypothetical protein